MNPPLYVIHEDDDLLVVNKPAGLVCHGAAPGGDGSLIDRIRDYMGDREGRLVNRLDRETSGVVVVARNGVMAGQLGALFSSGAVEKTYLAVVHGHLSAGLSVVEPIGPAADSAVAIRDAVRADGAPARTDLRPIRQFTRAGGGFTVVDVRPRSGRKHQIRIHLAHAGYPIVGDKIYGPDEAIYLRFVTRSMTREDWRRLILPHHALHASRLEFGWRGREWTFSAEPEPALTAFAAS